MWPALVAHGHGGLEPFPSDPHTADLDGGGGRAEVVGGAVGRELHLLRQRDDAEFVAVPVQHPQHEEVAAAEDVPGDLGAGVPQDTGHRDVLTDLGHVAVLAAVLPLAAVRVDARLPLEVWGLFGKRGAGPVRPHGVRDDRMAGGAEPRRGDVLSEGGTESGRRVHDSDTAPVGLERAEDCAALGRCLG